MTHDEEIQRLAKIIEREDRAYKDLERAYAAVKAAHQQEMARLTQERDTLRKQYEVAHLDSLHCEVLLQQAEAERDALRIQNDQMRHELLDIGGALRDPADNLIDTTAQCITRLRAERDTLAAQIAGLREALGTVYDAFRESLLDESYPQADAMARAALAASAPEGGTHE